MTTLHEAAQQAWADWVGKRSDHLRTNHNENIFKAGFEAALAQQGEPVAKYIGECQDGSLVQLYEDLKKGTELYAGATPAAQPDDAIIRAWQAGYYHAGYTHDQSYADKMAREYAAVSPAAQPTKLPGMAVQALAGEIIEALLADEKDGGYDLTAGLFGANFSALVRRWAAAEWNASTPQPDARKVVQQMVEALEMARSFEEGGKSLARAAIQAGQKWLEENKS